MTDLAPFHLALPVSDLAAARDFYGGLLGCREGRTDEGWIDFEFFGHQLATHLASQGLGTRVTNSIDGEAVPVPHFGVVLPWAEWQRLAASLKAAAIPFLIEPTIRFEGRAGEQATMFVLDPSGNALEFKSFKNPDRLFATAAGRRDTAAPPVEPERA
jgi:extradiol dioxygenase family protein